MFDVTVHFLVLFRKRNRKWTFCIFHKNIVVLYTLWRLLWSITVHNKHTELFYTIKIQMVYFIIFYNLENFLKFRPKMQEMGFQRLWIEFSVEAWPRTPLNFSRLWSSDAPLRKSFHGPALTLWGATVHKVISANKLQTIPLYKRLLM